MLSSGCFERPSHWVKRGTMRPHLCVRYRAKRVVLETGFKFLSFMPVVHCPTSPVHLVRDLAFGTVLFLRPLIRLSRLRWKGHHMLPRSLVSSGLLVCTGSVSRKHMTICQKATARAYQSFWCWSCFLEAGEKLHSCQCVCTKRPVWSHFSRREDVITDVFVGFPRNPRSIHC